MPRGGSRPGERRGGRKKGTRNKATVQMARIAERVLGEAKASGRRLGKEVLDYFMHIFTEIADAERAAALAERPETHVSMKKGSRGSRDTRSTVRTSWLRIRARRSAPSLSRRRRARIKCRRSRASPCRSSTANGATSQRSSSTARPSRSTPRSRRGRLFMNRG